ncbi:hypothetical protein EVG20_g6279 [Dentipellis fragilis]|uniref:Uncharacterized protein n=1 Tax=Dentipellis fragilis TaxID=205917 RepID=A0A4Y9YPR3_9AGAM|nr:hypothetical protein EVG20_g6279 [Dentipellis fragilis]
MLNLGDPQAMAVAVTGCLHPNQEPKALIVISSNSGSRSKDDLSRSRFPSFEPEPGVAVQTIAPSQLTIEEINKNSSDVVCLIQHIADVVAVLRHASVPIASQDGVLQYSLSDGQVSKWIHARCYRKIYHHIATSKREWPDQGLGNAMASWIPEETEHGNFKACDIQIPPVYADALKLCGFECRRFDFDTAPQWIRCISTILEMLEDCFVDSRPLKMKVPASKLNRLIGGLNFILRLPEVKLVITESSLPRHVRECVQASRRAKLSRIKEESTMSDSRPAEDETAGHAGCQTEHQMRMQMQTRQEKQQERASHDYVLHILAANQAMVGQRILLTPWQNAAHSLVVRLRKLGRPPSASVVELTNHSSAAVNDINENCATVVDHILARVPGFIPVVEEREPAIAWIEAHAKTTIATTKHIRAHAEAGLMALANGVTSVWNDESAPKDLCHIFMTDTLPIGASRKCCIMCYRLSLALTGRNAAKRFELPGTHGRILPWDPPCFGGIEPVLEELAKSLVVQVLQHAQEQGQRVADASRQPSPESDTERLLEDISY